jgi:hypothetical protein
MFARLMLLLLVFALVACVGRVRVTENMPVNGASEYAQINPVVATYGYSEPAKIR